MRKALFILVTLLPGLGMLLASRPFEGQAANAPLPDVVFVVSGPRADGSVVVSTASRSVSGNELSLRRVTLGLNAVTEIASKMPGEVTDKPATGAAYRYELVWQGRVLASQGVDLREKRLLKFTGGSAKRGVFELLEPGQPARTAVIEVGNLLAASWLTDDGTLVELMTGWRLESVTLGAGGEHAVQPVALTNERGEPVAGIDGQPLVVRSAVPARGGQMTFIAVLQRADGSGGHARLAEGATMDVER